ncbi:MAG: hypothetical protein H8E60_09805 [Candidatus Marinimicrobia bacterium]|nr:hypothetical protein [Candidatus Neomarinimicrobiota bacterium]
MSKEFKVTHGFIHGIRKCRYILTVLTVYGNIVKPLKRFKMIYEPLTPSLKRWGEIA